MKHESKESFDVNKVYNAIEKYTDIDQFAHGYAEPGYTQEHENHPVLFANWNPVPAKFMDWIEDHFDIEWSDDLDLESMGFRVLNDNRFESGMHQGMNDDPKTIFDEMQKAHPDYEFVFSGLEPSQFYMSYSIYGRLKQSI